MSVSTTVTKYGIEQAIKFMYKDPEKNLPKLMDWADTLCKGRFPGQRAAIRRAIEDPTYPYLSLIHISLALTPKDFDFAHQTLSISKTWDYKGKGGFQPTKNKSSVRKIQID